MKRILLCTILFAACNNIQPTQTPVPVRTISTLDSAKIIGKNILTYMEMCETKEITRKEFDSVARPLQHSLDSMRNILTLLERKELDDYRTQIVSGIIDRKVIRDKKTK